MKTKIKTWGAIIGIILLIVTTILILQESKSNKVCIDLDNVHTELTKLNQGKLEKIEEYILSDFPEVNFKSEQLIINKNYDKIKIYDYDEVVVCNEENVLLYSGKGNFLPINNKDFDLIKTHFSTGQGLFNVETQRHYQNYHVLGEDTSYLYDSITQINPKYISVCKPNPKEAECRFDNDTTEATIIDINGKNILNKYFQDVVIDSESSINIRVKEKNKVGLIDYRGKVVIPLDNDCLKRSVVNNANAAISDFNYYVSLKGNTITVYDKEGKSIFTDNVKSETSLYCDSNLRPIYEGWPVVPVDNIVEEEDKLIISFEHGEPTIGENKILEIVLDKKGKLINKKVNTVNNGGE